MHYKIVFLFVILLTSCTEIKDIKANNPFLTIKATCNQGKTCYFDDKDLFFTIEIRNNHHQEIGFPLEYIERKAPSIKLINKSENKETDVPTSPANSDLENKLVFIKPNETEKIKSVIPTYIIKNISGSSTEILAEINIFSKITIKEEGMIKKIDFSEIDIMPIIINTINF